jgi:hypothetical protein
MDTDKHRWGRPKKVAGGLGRPLERALLRSLGSMGTAIIGWYDQQGIIRRALTKGGEAVAEGIG